MNELLRKLNDGIHNIFILSGVLAGYQAINAFEVFRPKDVVILLESILDYLDDLQNESFGSMFADLCVDLFFNGCRIVYATHAVDV